MTYKQAEALRLAEIIGGHAGDELRRLHARVVELEAEVQELRKVKDAGIDRIADLTSQLEAIGAGGVESLRKKDAARTRTVDSGALQMVVNALRRDASEGKAIRGEMADELEKVIA